MGSLERIIVMSTGLDEEEGVPKVQNIEKQIHSSPSSGCRAR
jgi:hypothetical protein